MCNSKWYITVVRVKGAIMMSNHDKIVHFILRNLTKVIMWLLQCCGHISECFHRPYPTFFVSPHLKREVITSTLMLDP